MRHIALSVMQISGGERSRQDFFSKGNVARQWRLFGCMNGNYPSDIGLLCDRNTPPWLQTMVA
jgi:hypothetical protein